jgi:hypothetical protein
METGFTIRPRIVTVRTPEGGTIGISEETEAFLLGLRDQVKGGVVDKMRRGASPVEFSEQASVAARVTGGTRPSLRVYSYSVTAAVDEGGRAAVGVPPYGKTSALAAWAEFFLNTTQHHRVRGLAMAIATRGQPAPGDRLNQPFRRTQLEFNPIVRAGMRKIRDDVAQTLNRPGTYRRPRK